MAIAAQSNCFVRASRTLQQFSQSGAVAELLHCAGSGQDMDIVVANQPI